MFGLFLTIALGVAVGIWISKDPTRLFKALVLIILVILEYVAFIAIFIWVVFWVGGRISDKYSSIDLETLKYVTVFIVPMILLFLVGCWVGARKNHTTIGDYIESKLGERDNTKGLSINKKEFTKYILKWLGVSIIISVISAYILWLMGFFQ